MNNHRRSNSPLVRGLAALAAGLIGLWSAPAFACGGFFCFTQPIDQSAERILYLKKDDSITVHIQISYTGDDDKFSWILPLTAVPKLGIGSDSVFQVLEQGTAPRFQVDFSSQEGCWANIGCSMAASGGRSEDNTNGGGGVKVLAKENVGPYEAVTLAGNSGAELVKWLSDNGYQQPASSAPLIDQYAKTGYVFLALKLQKDMGAGDLAPIVVTLAEPNPCLPLRLTAIASVPELPVVAWVLADHRAIPKNFLHVEINEATVDWMNPTSNYKNVVSKAVDQASGHAFTTELARPTSKLPLSFANKEWKASDLDGITEPGAMLMKMLEIGLPRTSQLQQLIRKHIPKPEAFKDVADQQFYNCIQCDGCNEEPCASQKAAVKAQGFNAKAMVADLQTYVIAPLQAMQSAYEATPYLTRLYTLVSPPEMNKDPIFAFNAELPEVDNVHVAKGVAICKAGTSQAHQVKLTLKSGQEVTIDLPQNGGGSLCRGFGGAGGFGGTPSFNSGDAAPLSAGGQPAYRVEVLDEKGGPLEIDPRDADLVDAELSKAVAGQPSLSASFIATLTKSTWDPTKSQVDPKPTNGGAPAASAGGGGGGCNAGPMGTAGTSAAGLSALVAACALLLRRRRLV